VRRNKLALFKITGCKTYVDNSCDVKLESLKETFLRSNFKQRIGV